MPDPSPGCIPPPAPRCEPVAFEADGLRLAGFLHLPGVGQAPPVVVGSHGLFSTGNSAKQVALARHLSAKGIAFLRFDHRGCGGSQGEFARVTTLEGRRRDLLAAARYLRHRGDVGPMLGLFGSSLGGATCLAAWAALKPRRLVVVAAPYDSRSILEAADPDADRQTRALFGAPHFQFDLTPELPGIRDILVIHGTRDRVIPVAHARCIHRLAGDPKRLLLLADGDHRLRRPEHRENLLAEAAEWFLPLLEI